MFSATGYFAIAMAFFVGLGAASALGTLVLHRVVKGQERREGERGEEAEELHKRAGGKTSGAPEAVPEPRDEPLAEEPVDERRSKKRAWTESLDIPAVDLLQGAELQRQIASSHFVLADLVRNAQRASEMAAAVDNLKRAAEVARYDATVQVHQRIIEALAMISEQGYKLGRRQDVEESDLHLTEEDLERLLNQDLSDRQTA